MKTRRMDYHLHTSHSMDCERTMDSLCRRALALGLDEICVTDHIEPGHPQRELDIPPVWPNWQKDIAQCREKYPELILRAGIEIGDNAPIRDSIYETLAPLKLDFHLLSLHLVKNEDPYNQSYFDGKDTSQSSRPIPRRPGRCSITTPRICLTKCSSSWPGRARPSKSTPPGTSRWIAPSPGMI